MATGSPGGGLRRGPAMTDPTDLEDIQDVRESLGGNGEAYARLIRRHQDQIARRMWRFTRDRRMLEELVQDVFVEAYFNLASFRGEAPFGHWLNRIATRAGYGFWRQRRRERPGAGSPNARAPLSLEDWDGFQAAPEAPLEATEAAERLHELLARLPPRDRMVLMLMYVEELSVAEVARQTGWSQVMVKVQAFRARKKLKKLLEKAGLGGEGE